jgi:large subunit ribosomal protein L31
LALGSGIIRALFHWTRKVEGNMKADIHPRYEEITARCSCGNEIKTRSTLAQDITVDVCSRCHPFFTGKQKIVDSGGRVDRFQQALRWQKLAQVKCSIKKNRQICRFFYARYFCSAD